METRCVIHWPEDSPVLSETWPRYNRWGCCAGAGCKTGRVWERARSRAISPGSRRRWRARRCRGGPPRRPRAAAREGRGEVARRSRGQVRGGRAEVTQRGGGEGAYWGDHPLACSSSFLVAGVERSLPPSANPAARPETSAAELEPIPRVGGTAFWHSKRSGGISCPSVSSARLHIRTTMFFSLVSILSSPAAVKKARRPRASGRAGAVDLAAVDGCSRARGAPSPMIVIEYASARSTVTRFQTSRAKPKESKPGPRLAVVAGTLTTTRLTCIQARDGEACCELCGAAAGQRAPAQRSSPGFG